MTEGRTAKIHRTYIQLAIYIQCQCSMPMQEAVHALCSEGWWMGCSMSDLCLFSFLLKKLFDTLGNVFTT